jgi:hypothetical protein
MSNQEKNVVLSFATNMKADRVKVLAQSLRLIYSPEECDVVIFTNHVDGDLQKMAKDIKINFIYTDNLYTFELGKVSKVLIRSVIYPLRWLSKRIDSLDWGKFLFTDTYPSIVKLWGHPQLVRWLYFRDFLRLNRNYSKVIITDIKDVIFQDPFFHRLEEGKLYLTEQGLDFGPDHWDTRWYKKAYGLQELEKVKGKPALCCAIVAGGHLPVEQFLDYFCSEILNKPVGTTVDQAIFNYCYYSFDFSGVEVELLKNQGNPTLHAIHPQQIQEDFDISEQGIARQDGGLVPIIHGWDRNEKIFDYVASRFGVPGVYGYKGGYAHN